MNRIGRLCTGPLAVLACGCSSYAVTVTGATTPPVAPFGATAADQAVVCVYRAGVPSPLYTATVYDNAKLVGATRDGTFFCYLAEPGRHEIVSDATFGVQRARLTAVAGRHYYLKQEWLFPALRGHALAWVEASTVQEDLRDDEYAMLTEVPPDQALPGARPLAPAQP
jgi:hypothetical protein